MRGPNLYSLALLPAVLACSPLEEPSLGSSADAKACSAAQAAQSFGTAAIDPSLVRPSLSWAEASTAGSIRLVDVRLAQGSCASRVNGVLLSQVRLSNGVVLEQVPPDGRVAVRESGSAFHADSWLDTSDPHPELSGATFVMGARVGYRRQRGLTTDYIGLWRRRGEAVLQAFSVSEAGEVSSAIPVLKSDLPVRSVSYFPAPDTPSGRLGLVQEDRSGAIRLIGLDWYHSGLFR